MQKKLLEIINNYGVMEQLKYFQSEIFELNEAIITHELKKSVEYEIPLTEIIGTEEHILEEISDCLVMLFQFIHYYDFDKRKVMDIMEYKINRQLERIENGSKSN